MPWFLGRRSTQRRNRLLAAPPAVTTAAKSTLLLLTAASNNSPTQEEARERAKGPLRTQRNGVLAVIIHALYILAMVCLLGCSGSAAQEERAAIGNNTAAIAALSRIPFLHGETGAAAVDAPQLQEPRWVRVFSAKAAHPAMYVPGDGIVYCPIAKVGAVAVAATVVMCLPPTSWLFHRQRLPPNTLLGRVSARDRVSVQVP